MWSEEGYKKLYYNAVKTTQDIKVCKAKDLPPNKPRLGLNKHIEKGLCVMIHNLEDNNVLEVRGYDENCEEFSYKFHFDNDPSEINFKNMTTHNITIERK